MGYRIAGLDPEAFTEIAALDLQGLAAIGATRLKSTAPTGYPCRVSLDYAQPSEDLILLNFEHQPEPSSPFRAKGPIFVKPDVTKPAIFENALPVPMQLSATSMRAYDKRAMIVEAAVAQPGEAETVIEKLFSRPDVAYIHAHYAAWGCFAARIDRH